MAEISPSPGRKQKRSPTRSRKAAIKLDMTAMVDVAFLLLTFFVLSAVVSQQRALELVVPPACEGADCHVKVDEKKVLTLVLGEQNQIRYYHGITDPEVLKTDYSPKGIRAVIQQHLLSGGPLCRSQEKKEDCWDPIIVVKAEKTSRYGKLIEVLDELLITQAPKYTIASFTLQDSLLLAQAEILPKR